MLKEHEHPPKPRLLIRAFFCSSGGHGQGRRRYRDSARGEAVIKAHGSKNGVLGLSLVCGINCYAPRHMSNRDG